MYSLIRRGGAAWLRRPLVSVGAALVALVLVAAPAALAAAAPSPQVAAEATEPAHVGGEANLVLPDLGVDDGKGVVLDGAAGGSDLFGNRIGGSRNGHGHVRSL